MLHMPQKHIDECFGMSQDREVQPEVEQPTLLSCQRACKSWNKTRVVLVFSNKLCSKSGESIRGDKFSKTIYTHPKNISLESHALSSS